MILNLEKETSFVQIKREKLHVSATLALGESINSIFHSKSSRDIVERHETKRSKADNPPSLNKRSHARPVIPRNRSPDQRILQELPADNNRLFQDRGLESNFHP